MTLWKLEWLRLIRTKRVIGILGVFLFFGLLGPVTARYMEDIVKNFGGGVEIVVPEPIPADGITSYIANAVQVGLLVSMGIAAAALTFDSKPQMGVFLRTRVANVRAILLPRFVVITAAIVCSFVIGSIAALYETVVLLGSLSIGGWFAGTMLGCLYLIFAVAVVAAVAGKANSVLFTVMVSIGIMLVLPLLGWHLR